MMDTERPSSESVGTNSPMLVLAHELIHGFNANFHSNGDRIDSRDGTNRRNHYYDRKYGRGIFEGIKPPKQFTKEGIDVSFTNLEEKYTTVIITNQVAITMEEDLRFNYGGVNVSTKSTTSNDRN